jgi:hypothetical protein
MLPIVADPALVAACGLYCGACRKHRSGRCPGCLANEKAGWCKVRSCCLEHGYASCADCVPFDDPRDCPRFDNPIARVIGFLLRSDRAACVDRIREVGRDVFAAEMAARGAQSLRR